MQSYSRFLRCGIVLIAALGALAPVVAQEVLKPLKARGQFRDAVVDAERSRLFVAVYNEDAVWAIDPATGDVATKIATGDGPVALAEDGNLLAVANRLANTVTVIRLSDLSVAATVETGQGPSDIASLGDGRFLTANTFSDSLSIIDTRGTMSVTTLEDCPAVPVALAVSSDFVTVIGRAAKTAKVYDRVALAPHGTIALPAVMTHAATIGTNQIAMASAQGLYVVDASTRRVLRTLDLPAAGLSAGDGTILVTSQDSLRYFNYELKVQRSSPLDAEYPVVATSQGVVALLNPRNASALVTGMKVLEAKATPLADNAPAPEAAPDAPMVVVEARPVEEEAAQPAPAEPVVMEAPEEPVVVDAQAPGAPEPARDPEPVPASDIAMDESPEAEPATDAPEPATVDSPESTETESVKRPTSAQDSPSLVRQNPILTRGVRAPSLSRPSASPLQQLSQRTVADAIIRPTEFGSTEGGFQPPDLTQSLENIKAESVVGEAGKTKFTEFRAEWGDLTLTTKELTHQKEPVDIHAVGDVLITQQSSTITADDIHYRMPEATETPEEPQVLEDGESAALNTGRLTLNNAHIVEPTREMTADHIDYDFQTSKGELINAKGQAGIYYFSADKLHLHGPQTLSGENVWVTTCDRAHPHYRIRLSDVELVDGQPVAGSNARLQLGRTDTPLYLPRWRRGGVGGSPWNIDFDSGRQAETGYYANVGQMYEVTPDIGLGPRLFITEKEGVGFGADLSYDFMENPASHFYRTRGEAHGLYTTQDRGYVHWYHRYEYSDDLVVRAQLEHWSDENFYQDFYYDAFRNRSQPRSFANITYRQPAFIATGTVRPQTHGWFAETEQAPEATFHLLERPIADNLYVTFDSANGYYNREPSGVGGGRSANTARLTYSWDPHPAVAITPFVELDGHFYSRNRRQHDATGVLSPTIGLTGQTRLHRTYGGRWGFSAFKHVLVPSITYSYRPDTSVDPLDIPQYDPLDSIFGRSRIETKLANIFYGRDAETGEVWQVGRITLYQGNDLRNETRTTEDYEIEIDIRPRPWWGFQVVGERQVTANEDASLNPFSVARNFPGVYSAINEFLGRDEFTDVAGRFGDYNRILSQLYYDGTPLGEKVSGRVGFAYTETRGEVFNREALYGLGYRISDKWGFGFEHIYDFEDGDLRSQTYELRRSLHCWETAIRFRDRESGFDINFEFNIKAFPGSRVKI